MKTLDESLYYKAVEADEKLSEALSARFGRAAQDRRYDMDKSEWGDVCRAAYSRKIEADEAWLQEMRR